MTNPEASMQAVSSVPKQPKIERLEREYKRLGGYQRKLHKMRGDIEFLTEACYGLLQRDLSPEDRRFVTRELSRIQDRQRKEARKWVTN